MRWPAVLSAVGLAAMTVVASADGPPPEATTPPFVAPRISHDYLDALAKMPDWNGSWDMTGGTPEQRLMFDVDHLYYPADPGGIGMGPMAGAQDVAIPLNAKYAKIYSATLRKEREGFSPDPVGNCKEPHGMPRAMGGMPDGPTIVMTPTYIEMGWAWLGAARRIFIDGRPHPAHLHPGFMGHSIGHWEGDTLVVDTIGMIAGVFDQSGAPHSDQVHLIERLRLVEKDLLENRMTIEDPVAFSEPWKVVRRYHRNPDPHRDLFVSYCPPGDQNLKYENGYQQAVLPSELDHSKPASTPKRP